VFFASGHRLAAVPRPPIRPDRNRFVEYTSVVHLALSQLSRPSLTTFMSHLQQPDDKDST